MTNKFIDTDFGGNTFPCFVDIDNDSDIDLILGNVKGGLYFYVNTDISNIVTRERKQPLDFEVKAFPNPFNPATQINLQLPAGQNVTVEIFNLLGERVKTLYKGYLSSGPHTFTWDAKNNSGLTLPAGIYLVLVTSIEVQKVIKIVFLK